MCARLIIISNLAVQHGWKVLQFDTKMVKSGVGLETTERVLRGEK